MAKKKSNLIETIQEVKTDKRGQYYQAREDAKKRYFDPEKKDDQERARRVSSRD